MIPRTRFGRRYGLADTFRGTSRPDMVAVHHGRRRILVGDVTARPDAAHLAKTIAYARWLARRLDPALTGYRVLAQDWYWALPPEYGRRSWPTSRRIVVSGPPAPRATELLPELGEAFAWWRRTPPRRTPPRRKSPRPVSRRRRRLHGALHEPLDPTRTTNKYPPFAPPGPAEAATVAWYARKLSDQIFRATQGKVRLYVNPGHILVAPWISRITKDAASVLGSRRDTDAFWRAYAKYRPAAVASLDPGHRVSAAYAAAMGWPASTIGQKLIHHHIDNHAYVAAIPQHLHKYAIHGRREVLARPY